MSSGQQHANPLHALVLGTPALLLTPSKQMKKAAATLKGAMRLSAERCAELVRAKPSLLLLTGDQIREQVAAGLVR